MPPAATPRDHRIWCELVRCARDAAKASSTSKPQHELKAAFNAARGAVVVGLTGDTHADRDNPCNQLFVKVRAYLDLDTAGRREAQQALHWRADDCAKHLTGHGGGC